MNRSSPLPLTAVVVAGLCTLLGAASGWARSTPAQDEARAIAVSTKDSACEEEKQVAEPWIRWAVESRAACLTQFSETQQRSACLNRARAKLAEFEREHTGIYLSQIKTLDASHPAVKAILARLRANRETAALGIDRDSEPAELARLRKQRCLHQP